MVMIPNQSDALRIFIAAADTTAVKLALVERISESG